MDESRFDHLVRALAEAGTRRGLLSLLAMVPLLGGFFALFDDADAKGRRKRRKKRHKHGKGRQRNRPCQPKPRATICAGTCGIVKTKQTCQKKVNCGACAPCGDVCASGCPFSSVQAAIDAASDGDTITLCAGTYQAGAELLIDTSLTLIGAGDGNDPLVDTILDGQGQHRVVRVVAGVTVDLQGLRITGGNGAQAGGGISNTGGQVTLTGCAVIANASQDGGGILNNIGGEMTLIDSTVSGNTAGAGGGIINYGSLTLTESTVSGNSANAWGGGIGNVGGALTLTDSTVRDNSANDSGGIYNDGTLLLTDSTVSGNTADVFGGGLFNANAGTVSLMGDSRVCENTVDGQPSNCVGFTPPAAACTETCPA